MVDNEVTAHVRPSPQLRSDLPSDRSPDAIADWRRALASMAKLDHVSITISGIGQPDLPWTVGQIASTWSAAEQLAAFAGNAVRFYRLPEGILAL